MLMRHAIGAVLRRRRLERGRTLRQLAEESRVSLPYLSEIERGRKEVSSEILGILCRALDLTEKQLLDEVGSEFEQNPGVSGVAGTRVHNSIASVHEISSRRETSEIRSATSDASAPSTLLLAA